MRLRHIKPEFFKDEKLGKQPLYARYLFIGLWMLADKNGCLEYSPRRIGVEVFPYDDFSRSELLEEYYGPEPEGLCCENEPTPTEAVVELGLDSLVNGGFIHLYHDKNDKKCICIINFLKHQKRTSWEKKESLEFVSPPTGFRPASA